MSKKSKGPVIIKEKSGEILEELEKRLEKAVNEVQQPVKGDEEEEPDPINILEQKKFGRLCHDQEALDQMIESFFMVDQSTQCSPTDFADPLEGNVGVEPPKKDKQQKSKMSCPAHSKFTPNFFCTKADCDQQVRVMCEQCVLQGPHLLHDHRDLQDVLLEVKQCQANLMEQVSMYKGIDKQIIENFDRIKLMFSSGLDFLKENFLQELKPEFKKLTLIKEFLTNTKPDSFKKKFINKDFNRDLYQLIYQKNIFLDKITPDKARVKKFFEFFQDRVERLQFECKKFIKTIFPNFLQEINYLQYERWSDECRKIKLLKQMEKQAVQASSKETISLVGKIQYFLEGHSQIVNDIKKLGKNSIATCSYDQKIIVWNIDRLQDAQGVIDQLGERGGSRFRTIKTEGIIKKIEPVLNNMLAAIPEHSNMIYVYDWEHGILLKKLVYKDILHSLYFSPPNQVLYAGSGIGDLVPYQANNDFQQIKEQFKYSEYTITVIRGEGEILACGNIGGQILIEGGNQGKRELKILSASAHSDAVLDITIMSKNQLISCGFDKRILQWDMETNQVVREIIQLKNELSSFIKDTNDVSRTWKILRFSENILVMAGENSIIQFYDILRGQILKELKGHLFPVYAMAILDDQRIVAGGKDQVVFVWN